ncbi:hypothetical protein BO79DRAFT_230513 [Aspergillus costaricaensis CBS 115574]|uniref:Uncharacterized protein n=1 Tax=Aspergillus costaricaensis CBS 115574 TaxID=1448317 RepID=A0ACD1I7X3_9EURO|nr:hypothetical protein BO79DRAFT_230513 [Aspergillus costaricaensis CBS 115574]RAK86459.1 hypothetical protein BO79DRAFT_230513 [Aspergillus costaricaensis CBS 115574]
MACMKAEACCCIVWSRHPPTSRGHVTLSLTVIAEEKVVLVYVLLYGQPYLHGNASERALVTKNCRGALPWGHEMGMIRKAARDYRQALTLWTETRRGHRTGKDAAIKSTRRTQMCQS